MSKSQRLESVLDQAKEREKEYDWVKAAGLYEQALRVVGKNDFLEKGKIQERTGYCFFRAAFQAETQEEFKKHMGLSVETYEEAARFFEELEDSKKHARTGFCRGTALYSKSWLADDSSERKALLDECRKIEKEALQAYEETGDRAEYGKTCNELLTCLLDRLAFTWDWQERKNILEEVVEHGEKAVGALSEVRDDYELARAYYMLNFHLYEASSVYESIEKQEEICQKGLTYAKRASEISEKVEDSYLIGWSCLAIAGSIMEYKGDYESSLRYRERALKLGKRINDKLMIARASGMLSYNVWWKALTEEDPDKRRRGFNRAIQYCKDAITHYKLVSLPPLAAVGEANYIWTSAFDETSLEKKRVLLEKAVEVGKRDLDHAERSGLPWHIHFAFHSLSKALFSLSTMETKKTEKRKLLEKASKYREETVKLSERLSPFDYWNRGVVYNYLAEIKAEQAKNETDSQRKIDLLKQAVLDMEDCVKLCRTTTKAMPQKTMLIDAIGYFQYDFGGILNQLYLLTREQKHLERAIMVYEEVVHAWEKTDRRSNMAEAHWQMAKLYDQLGKFSEATNEFESASERYILAAEKIQQLKTFYTDYVMYMRAWSEIEKAKHRHTEKQYGLAKKHYKKAADLHKKTQRWSYLTPNYLALALVEEAEDLSRREQTEEAKDLFQRAAKLFLEAKESIKDKLKKIEARDEKEMSADLSETSDVRREYCLGRIALEEAKILDRQGNHFSSSAKYASAAEKFQKTIDVMEGEADRRELKPIVDLCRAWQMMTQAEAEASPDLYLEASRLFDEAKEHSLEEKTKILALGHSRFCKALEAGTRFEDTRDTKLHSEATRHLESAASYYLKAGFKSASEYAEATQKLLDAYLYMHNAKTETDPAKKARFYMIAEKVLQVAAGSYLKAKHPEKQEQVSRLLEKIREERELALSLTEVLHAPLAISTTATFTSPTPTREIPIGLEQFQHADIQGNLLLRVKEVNVGEELDLRMELVNAGKTPALLVKVDEMVPEGFEIKKVPEVYSVEDSYLNMKGKRLNPLKTEDVKITIKPSSKGTFTIKPRVLYLDETGKYKSHELEPVTVVVRELGISGWIKGEK